MTSQCPEMSIEEIFDIIIFKISDIFPLSKRKGWLSRDSVVAISLTNKEMKENVDSFYKNIIEKEYKKFSDDFYRKYNMSPFNFYVRVLLSSIPPSIIKLIKEKEDLLDIGFNMKRRKTSKTMQFSFEKTQCVMYTNAHIFFNFYVDRHALNNILNDFNKKFYENFVFDEFNEFFDAEIKFCDFETFQVEFDLKECVLEISFKRPILFE